MKGRIPAYCHVELEGSNTISGVVSGYFDSNSEKYSVEDSKDGIPSHANNVSQKTYNNQRFLKGNRIGHDPKLPKKFTAPSHHKRPPTLSEITASFSESYFKAKLYKRLYHHLDSQGVAARLIRSEFREMISIGCAIITHYYDVLTGQIGFYDSSGKYITLSYKQLADKLEVSLIRIKRFFRFLKERGFAQIVPDKKIDNKGEWRSKPARKIITPKFFIDTLGICAWKKINHLKEYLHKKWKPKTVKLNEKISTFSSVMGNFKNTHSKYKDKAPSKPEQEKQIVQEALLMHEHYPDIPLLECYRQIKIKAQSSKK